MGIYEEKEGCCVERSQCLCKAIDGVVYGEGDKIWSMSDECKSCYCMDHGIHCLGLPCPDNYQPPCLPSTIKFWEKEEAGRYNPYVLRPPKDVCIAEVGRQIENCPPSQQNPCGYQCENLCHAWKAATYECIRTRRYVLFYLRTNSYTVFPWTGFERRVYLHLSSRLSMYSSKRKHFGAW